MADSLRTDPRAIRAARRCHRLPRVHVHPPGPGDFHPASEEDVGASLDALGPAAYYGLREVWLAAGLNSSCGSGPVFGRYSSEGAIRLFAQPVPPWRLSGVPPGVETERLATWGAAIRVLPSGLCTLVTWPSGALRRFMLLDVLLHEIGHHVLQHERRKVGAPVARTADHEAFARDFARRHRAALAAALSLECPAP